MTIEQKTIPSDNSFTLTFDGLHSGITGYSFGKKIFKEQVKENIDYSKTILIRFPQNITGISSSFVQGFFEEILQKIGYPGIRENVIIHAASPELEKQIRKNIR